ncbi:MAG: hypothetical protein K1X89_01905 [Myxococcaceae bacterium]|nr:hypothetical protein [Myxococcaceae bacterium]
MIRPLRPELMRFVATAIRSLPVVEPSAPASSYPLNKPLDIYVMPFGSKVTAFCRNAEGDWLFVNMEGELNWYCLIEHPRRFVLVRHDGTAQPQEVAPLGLVLVTDRLAAFRDRLDGKGPRMVETTPVLGFGDSALLGFDEVGFAPFGAGKTNAH